VRLTGIWLDLDLLGSVSKGAPMKKKPPGVFSLIVTAFTGLGAHLVALCVTGRDRVLAFQGRKARPGKR
jgi:hypothetical protein